MRRPAMWLAAALTLLPAAALAAQSASGPPTAQPPATAFFPFPMEVHRLPNGLTYVFVPFDSPGLAAFYAVVRTGSRNEVEPGRSGFAHFFEHMMFRGTEKYPQALYDQLLSKAGLAHNAFTTDDFTAYHAYGPSSQLPLLIELEADRFQNLKYSEEDFRTEARAVLGEYNKNFANPVQKLDEVFLDTAFQRHTYKHTTMGFREDIVAMPEMYEYSLEFFGRWYTPDNTTILVVGDFDRQKVADLLRQHFGSWQGTAAELEVPREPKQTERRAVRVEWDNPTQPRFMLGWHTPEARVDSNAAAIQNVLGPYLFGPTSPAFRDLVLDRQLVTGLAVAYYDHRDPTMFYLLATLKDAKDLDEVRNTILRSVEDLRAGVVDAKRMESVKSNLKYGVLNSFDNAQSVAEQLAFAIGSTGDPRALDALFAHMERLRPADLVAFTRTFFLPSNETFVVLTGPDSPAPQDLPLYRPDPNRARIHESPSTPPSSQPEGGAR